MSSDLTDELRDALRRDLHRAFVSGWEAAESSAKMPPQNVADTRERRIEDDFLLLCGSVCCEAVRVAPPEKRVSDAGRAVLDAKRVQHVAGETPGVTVCGERYVALDLHWAETTRIHCIECLWFDVVGIVAEALHYFGAHNPTSPRHESWVALDAALGPARDVHKFPEGDPAVVLPSDSRAESQAGLIGPSGSPTSPSGIDQWLVFLDEMTNSLKNEETAGWYRPANRIAREYTARLALIAVRELRHRLTQYELAASGG